MNEWIRRTALGAGIPVVVAAMGLGPYLAYRSDLPDRVASHYGISGRPDGSMTPELFFIVIGALVALVVTQLTELLVVMILLVIAMGLAAFSRIRVTADRSGLQVLYGFFGWPRTSVPIHCIATAQAIDIRPADWGGWGYRGSLTLMKRAAVVLRAGPGIRLDLHDGKIFAVTIDDPENPVRLLNAEVSRLTT